MPRELSTAESTQLRGKMLSIWAWDGGYWHPLKPIEGSDLLAFDASCLEELLPEQELHDFLATLEAGDTVLFREHDPDQLLRVNELPFFYGWSEAVLAPPSMSWVVYWSHEGTITFGGTALLAALKARLPNFESALWR